MSRSCGSWYYLNTRTGEIATWYCNGRRCFRDECRQVFAANRVRLIEDMAREYGLDKFFTLTLDRRMALKEAWGEIPHLWAMMLCRLRRFHLWPGPQREVLRYVAVLEEHQDGYPHIHGLTNLFIPKWFYTEAWDGLGAGKITWVERVKGDAGDYMGKELRVARYFGKQQIQGAAAHLAPKARQMWRSKGMKTEKERRKAGLVSDWVLMKEERPGLYRESGLSCAGGDFRVDTLTGALYTGDKQVSDGDWSDWRE